MSCNGCRVLRKGCSESCILRPCLQWIESPEAQGHATVFVAKFFGRAGLMSFISSVPENQRPALFQSLLFEACGRTVNPVNGAVGLLWTGNWHVCQAAVETVLRGGTLRPMSPEVVRVPAPDQSDDAVVYSRDPYNNSPSTSRSKGSKRKGSSGGGGGGGGVSVAKMIQPSDLDLCLMQGISNNMSTAMGSSSNGAEEMMMAMTTMMRYPAEKRRQGTPSMNSEESVTTSFESSDYNNNNNHHSGEHKLLNLFV